MLLPDVNVYYKVGQHFLLQSEANCVTKWGSSFITKWDRFYYKMEQVLQSGARFITKWGRYYKVGHCYKVVHNNFNDKFKEMFSKHEENIKLIISANTKIPNDRIDMLNEKIDDFQ